MKLATLTTALGHALNADVHTVSTDPKPLSRTVGSVAVTLHLILPDTPEAGRAERHRRDAWLRSSGWMPCGPDSDRHFWHRSYPGVLLRAQPGRPPVNPPAPTTRPNLQLPRAERQ